MVLDKEWAHLTGRGVFTWWWPTASSHAPTEPTSPSSMDRLGVETNTPHCLPHWPLIMTPLYMTLPVVGCLPLPQTAVQP